MTGQSMEQSKDTRKIFPIELVDFSQGVETSESDSQYPAQRGRHNSFQGLYNAFRQNELRCIIENTRLEYSNKKFDIAGKNLDMIASAGESRDRKPVLVTLVHGLMQKGFNFLPLAKELRGKGDFFPYIALFDYRAPFKEKVDMVSETLEKVNKLSIWGTKVSLGFSTGADILRYAIAKGKLPNLEGAFFSAPLKNGTNRVLLNTLLFGNLEDYAIADNPLGKEVLEVFKTPLDIPTRTFIGRFDEFAPIGSSIDYMGKSYLVPCGHLALSGVDPEVNTTYRRAIKGFIRDTLHKRQDGENNEQ